MDPLPPSLRLSLLLLSIALYVHFSIVMYMSAGQAICETAVFMPYKK